MKMLCWTAEHVDEFHERWNEWIKSYDGEPPALGEADAVMDTERIGKIDRYESAVQKVSDLRQTLTDAPQGDGYPPDSSVWVLDQVLKLFEDDRVDPKVVAQRWKDEARVHPDVDVSTAPDDQPYAK